MFHLAHLLLARKESVQNVKEICQYMLVENVESLREWTVQKRFVRSVYAVLHGANSSDGQHALVGFCFSMTTQ